MRIDRQADVPAAGLLNEIRGPCVGFSILWPIGEKQALTGFNEDAVDAGPRPPADDGSALVEENPGC